MRGSGDPQEVMLAYVNLEERVPTARAEREAVPVMLDDARQRGYRPRTLGADKGYDTRECVRAMRNRAHHTARQLQGKPEGPQEGGGSVRVDEDGGGTTTDTLSRVERTGLAGYFVATAYNLVRMANLV